MKKIAFLLMAVLVSFSANAIIYSHSFNNTPLSEAIVTIHKENPDLDIFFIYDELSNYKTSAKINTDNIYTAIKQIIGLNPVSLIKKGDKYYIEVLQHGKYGYKGRVISSDEEPVVAATVMLLEPKDSTVLTYGITDNSGYFSIPCDKSGVIAKITCLGYRPLFKKCDNFSIGTVTMTEVPTELKTVTVKADNAYLDSDRSTYIPSSRQKNAAQNAIDLLRHMAIPQIQINPITDAVTDNAGGGVTIFINYLEASNEEMEGLRTADVKKVEYLVFPTDPRFKGAQRVINILVQQYVYGGYSKLTTNENFLTGFSGRNSIFSKFSYKKMTYDLYAGANNRDNRHTGNTAEGIYSLKKDDGTDYTITRTQTLDDSHYKQNQYPVTLRATYLSDKIQVRNTVGYTHLDIPRDEQQGSLTIQPGSEQNYKFNRSNPNRHNSLSYQGSLFAAMPKQFSVDLSTSFNYTHNNDYMAYSASNATEIIRHARENAYFYRINAFLQKRIGKKHTATLGINGGQIINRLNYSGTNTYRDRFHNSFAVGILSYKFQTRKISLYFDGGIYWEGSDINGEKYNDIYPAIHLNVNFSPNSKNAFSTYFQYATNSPGIDMKASDVLQENEYLYIAGNPLLKNSRHITLNLSYTWMPSNSLALSVYNNFFELINRQVIAYEPYNYGTSLLRTYINNGNYCYNEIGASANWKLFDGKLQLYASPKQTFFKSTGIYNRSYNPFTISAQATYYLKNLYFAAYYRSPGKQMGSFYPQIYKDRNFHSLTVGWANSDWNIRLMAVNFFNKGWQSAYTVTESPLYTEYRETFGTSSHSRINIVATYTFAYGKKVKRGNEVGEQSGGSSAILK